MSEHKISISWKYNPHSSEPDTYTRNHKAEYSNKTHIAVSAAPDFLGSPDLADPEQLLANALASCHLLYFLAICEGNGYTVESYNDEAIATVEKLPEGGFGVTAITLQPSVVFRGNKRPDAKTLNRLHDRAHKGCFIANSIKSDVRIKPAE